MSDYLKETISVNYSNVIGKVTIPLDFTIFQTGEVVTESGQVLETFNPATQDAKPLVDKWIATGRYIAK